MDRLFFENSIGEIIRRVRDKELSPSQVVEASLNNITELDQKYFAWVNYCSQKVLEEVKKGDISNFDDPGLLEGIPVGIKDIFNTADFPTQMGSPLWKDFTPGNDARSVFNLKRQGALVIGKTVTAEFAVHALDKTLNPHDITRTPGTSSSGSAVAVTLGMVPAATGTQTAGSIIRPASFCGVYGCKPSFGLIPRTGTLKTTDSLDSIGYFVIHEQDLQRVFDSLRIYGRDYPMSHAALTDPQRQHKPEERRWRVGFARTHTWGNAPTYAQKALENFIEKLKVVHDIAVTEVTLPLSIGQAHRTHETIYNKALSYYFKSEYKQSDFVSPIMNELIKKGSEINPREYLQALGSQMEIIRDMDSFFNDFDVLLSLSTAGEAPLRDVVELPDPALMWTLAHLPVVGVPAFTSPNGLPFGLQVVARKYNDYLLFEFLDYLQSLNAIPARAGKME